MSMNTAIFGKDIEKDCDKGESGMLDVEVDVVRKQCCIWVYGKNRKEVHEDSDFQSIVTEYQKKQYDVMVFIGGEKPLVPVMAELFAIEKAQGEMIEAS